MDYKEHNDEEYMSNKTPVSQSWVITYRQLGLIIFTFVLGVIATLLFSTTFNSSTSTFSPTDLINFVLSVILSSASIVLAIVAISLGKSSEKVIMDRNDESIRLQNEVFLKTTDALQRIQSSTGVTEKRIEDIISGRVGDMSQTLAEELSSQKKSGVDKEELESEIRNSLMKSINISERNDRQTKRREELKKKREEQRNKDEKYQKTHMEILTNILNEKNFKVIKSPSHGDVDKDGLNKYDCVLEENGVKIGISTFRKGTEPEALNVAITSTLTDMDNSFINKYLVILFDNDIPEKVTITLASLIDKYKNNIYLEAYTENSSSSEIINKIL